MSDIKMSDVFVLPVSSNKGDLFNSKNPISDTRICKFYNMNQFHASMAAAYAINSHDKLTEQNKMLRDALNEIRDQPLSAPEIDDLIDKVMETTKC